MTIFRRSEGNISRESMAAQARNYGVQYESFVVSGTPLYKVREGKNHIRILPVSWVAPKGHTPVHYGLHIYTHFGIGGDRGSYICYEYTNKEFLARYKYGLADLLAANGIELPWAVNVCPVEAERRKAKDAGDKELANALSSGMSVFAWVIDRLNPDAGPGLFKMPFKKVDREIVNRCSDQESGVIFPEDDVEGYDIIFNCANAGKKTADYSGVTVARKATPLHTDKAKIKEWLKFIDEHSLPKVLNWPDPEKIIRELEGVDTQGVTFGDGEPEPGDVESEVDAAVEEDPFALPVTDEMTVDAVGTVDEETDDAPFDVTAKDDEPSNVKAVVQTGPASKKESFMDKAAAAKSRFAARK